MIESVPTFGLVEQSREKRSWTLSVQPDALVLETAGGPTYSLPHATARAALDIDALVQFGMLKLRLDRPISFRHQPDVQQAVLQWIGPPTRDELVQSLKRRYGRANLIIGVVMIVISTPWLFPSWFLTVATDAKADAFDWLLMIWGAGNLVCYAVTRLAPHRILFVLDGAFQLAISAWWSAGIVTGQRHWAWSFVPLLAVFGMKLAYRQYRRFAQL